MLKRNFKHFLRTRNSPFLRKFAYVGPKSRVIYFFMQRICRINSHVKWPVHWASIVTFPNRIKMKDWRPYLGYMPGQYIQALNGIEIGRNLRIGPGVKLISASHDLSDYAKHVETAPIVIGDNCWIGADSIILPGVKLGDHVIVAAGSVVTKSFEPDCLIGGTPARIIKKLDAYSGNMEEW